MDLSHSFDQIEIQGCLAPQNDHQNHTFVKYINIVGNIMTRNACEMAKHKGCQFFKSPVFKLSVAFLNEEH